MRMFLKGQKLERIWTPKSDGVVYPMTQIPPQKRYLSGFTWFDYIRPLSKEDIFVWRGKKAGTELKVQKRREAPLQKLSLPKDDAETSKPDASQATDTIQSQTTDTPQIQTPEQQNTPIAIEQKDAETEKILP